MAINKLQRSRLTFDLSAKALILEFHQYIKTKFSQKPLNLIFLEKLIFLILLKPKSSFSLDMLRGNSKGQG